MSFIANIPNIDRVDIVDQDGLRKLAKSFYLDGRKFVTRSFTRFLDYEDAWQMKKTEQQSIFSNEEVKQVEGLYKLLKNRGFMNIFFCTQDELSQVLFGSILNRNTLKYRLEKLRVKGVLRWYNKNHGIKHNLWKVCINPSYGFKWQMVENDEDGLTKEDYINACIDKDSQVFGTEVIRTDEKPSAISSPFYFVMNNYRQAWYKTLDNKTLTRDRLVIELSESFNRLPEYINGSPVLVVTDKKIPPKQRSRLSNQDYVALL